MDQEMIVTDQTILAFYRENTNLDFITMNHILIDILKKLSTNLNETVTNSINGKILSTLNDINKELTSNKHELYTKLLETKKDYIEDVKIILSNNTLTTSDKINNILEKNNDTVITKTNLLLSEIVPKNQEKYYTQIDSSIKNLYNSLSVDTHKLIENINKDDKSIQNFISNIDNQFNKMITSIQQPIFSFLQSSEERTNLNIQQVREKLLQQQNAYDSLTNEFHCFFNKYKYNSSEKGNISEKELYMILQEIFPHDEIIDCRSQTATCDYRVNRFNTKKPTILFENKDYEKNVTTDEVIKFQRDLSLQKTHGIFISQKSSITFKTQFQIDIIDSIIHIYIPKANYSLDKLKIAVDIIDSLSQGLENVNKYKDNNFNFDISKDDLDELLVLYNDFTKQKANITNTIKTSCKNMLDCLEEFNINKVKLLLIKYGFLIENENFKCKYCNSYAAKNKGGLSAHYRGCKNYQDSLDKNENNLLDINIQTQINKQEQLDNIIIEVPKTINNINDEDKKISKTVDTKNKDNLLTNKKNKK
jgi:hypothetical protein